MGTAGKVLVTLLAALGVGAGIAYAYEKNASANGGGGGGNTTPKVTLSGQAYFNGLPAAQQNTLLAALYQWYQDRKDPSNPTWPASVGDPGLTSVNDLVTDGGPNFGIVVDAYQTFTNDTSTGGVAGVLDANIAGSLLADYQPAAS